MCHVSLRNCKGSIDQEANDVPSMSSSNVSDRPKITVSLEEWEIQAQLDDVQVKSINLLKDLCQERQLPLKVRLSF